MLIATPGLLLLLYPQFATDDLEVTVARRERKLHGARMTTTGWYVAVWVKATLDGKRVIRLLETGPERDKPEKAVVDYIELRLGPAISELAEQHMASTNMKKWGTFIDAVCLSGGGVISSITDKSRHRDT